MRIIFPKTIILESSNVSESLYSEYDYSGGTSYPANTRVYVSYEPDGVTERVPHKVFKALSYSTNKYPPDNPLSWEDQGGSNRWKMFDDFLNTQTENSDSIVVEIDASNCDRICFFNLDAETISIKLTDNETSTVLIDGSYDVSDKLSLILTIYIYPDATAKITISKTGTAKCGACIPGWSTYLGDTQWGITPGMTDYSIKDIGPNGVYISEGAWSKDIDLTTLFRRVNIPNVFFTLVDARGVLVGVECNGTDTNYNLLRGYGYIENWEITDFNPKVAQLNMTFRGVI